MSEDELTRRRFLHATLAAVPLAVIIACTNDRQTPAGTGTTEPPQTTLPSTPITLPPTPACTDGDETPDQTEGPYFTPNSPERASIAPAGAAGTALVVSGFVLGTDCKPMIRALVDFWQADADGDYDNRGYNFRGHQFTDANGRFRVQTRVPGLYPGRTRHIHVKVQRPGGQVLTTQLYFPGEQGNARDGIFNDALVMSVQDSGSGKTATFNFVLA